jgi:pimeloyl-ACP methyl ester carboxylesterase
MAKPTVVLVHGAWADGSSWAKVIPQLERQGIQTAAVELPLTSFADDVAAARRAIDKADGPVVLAGHSYGGAVITEAGGDPKVTGLVYVAAFAPDAGESAGSLIASVEPAPLAAEVRPDAKGFLRLTEKGVREDFVQDLPAAEQLAVFEAQGPTNTSSFGGAITRPAWKAKPSWYMVAAEDRAIPPALERRMAERIGADTVEVDSGHVAMLSHPKETCELIARAANA